MPELTPEVLLEHLEDFHFVGTDPSCVYVMDEMKEMWEAAGRAGTHFYQGFKDIRFETLETAIREARKVMDYETVSTAEVIKAAMGKINLRDGFKISNSLVHLNENWMHSKFGEEETRSMAAKLISSMDERDANYMMTTKNSPFTAWMTKRYSPERAEKLRIAARDNVRWGGYKLFHAE